MRSRRRACVAWLRYPRERLLLVRPTTETSGNARVPKRGSEGLCRSDPVPLSIRQEYSCDRQEWNTNFYRPLVEDTREVHWEPDPSTYSHNVRGLSDERVKQRGGEAAPWRTRSRMPTTTCSTPFPLPARKKVALALTSQHHRSSHSRQYIGKRA